MTEVLNPRRLRPTDTTTASYHTRLRPASPGSPPLARRPDAVTRLSRGLSEYSPPDSTSCAKIGEIERVLKTQFQSYPARLCKKEGDARELRGRVTSWAGLCGPHQKPKDKLRHVTTRPPQPHKCTSQRKTMPQGKSAMTTEMKRMKRHRPGRRRAAT